MVEEEETDEVNADGRNSNVRFFSYSNICMLEIVHSSIVYVEYDVIKKFELKVSSTLIQTWQNR